MQNGRRSGRDDPNARNESNRPSMPNGSDVRPSRKLLPIFRETPPVPRRKGNDGRLVVAAGEGNVARKRRSERAWLGTWRISMPRSPLPLARRRTASSRSVQT
jgi:hypothetical protein